MCVWGWQVVRCWTSRKCARVIARTLAVIFFILLLRLPCSLLLVKMAVRISNMLPFQWNKLDSQLKQACLKICRHYLKKIGIRVLYAQKIIYQRQKFSNCEKKGEKVIAAPFKDEKLQALHTIQNIDGSLHCRRSRPSLLRPGVPTIGLQLCNSYREEDNELRSQHTVSNYALAG